MEPTLDPAAVASLHMYILKCDEDMRSQGVSTLGWGEDSNNFKYGGDFLTRAVLPELGIGQLAARNRVRLMTTPGDGKCVMHALLGIDNSDHYVPITVPFLSLLTKHMIQAGEGVYGPELGTFQLSTRHYSCLFV